VLSNVFQATQPNKVLEDCVVEDFNAPWVCQAVEALHRLQRRVAQDPDRASHILEIVQSRQNLQLVVLLYLELSTNACEFVETS